MDMERGNQEPEPSVDIDQALWRIQEDQIVQFLPERLRLLTYTPAGVTEANVSSFTELHNASPKLTLYDNYVTQAIKTDEFLAWTEGLITPEVVVEAAIEELERRKVEGDEEVLPCSSCEGKPYSELCFCVLDKISFSMDTNETSGAPLASDPNCETCEGSGTLAKECVSCEGSRKMVKYLNIILRNEATGAERVLKIDIVSLIASGEVDVEMGGAERTYPNGHQIVERDIRVDLSRCLDGTLGEIGIDRKNAAVVMGDYVGRLDGQQVTIASAPTRWQQLGGKVDYNQSSMSAAEVLADVQTKLSKAYARPFRKVKNEEGLVVGGEWTLRPMRPMEDVLNDLKTAAAEKGCTLCFAPGFIATQDELGPCFFLVDSYGKTWPLSGDYAMREALESAWLMFQSIKNDLPNRAA